MDANTQPSTSGSSRRNKPKANTKGIYTRAIKEAFVKLNPKQSIKNPVMFLVWIGTIIAILLLADSMRQKQPVPETSGTLRTDTFLFTTVTAGIILVLGVLTFFPVLALGPIAEAFSIASRT